MLYLYIIFAVANRNNATFQHFYTAWTKVHKPYYKDINKYKYINIRSEKKIMSKRGFDIRPRVRQRLRIAKRRLSRWFDRQFASDERGIYGCVCIDTPRTPLLVALPAHKCTHERCETLVEYRKLLYRRGFEVHLELPRGSSTDSRCERCILRKQVERMKGQESPRTQQEASSEREIANR